MPRKYANVVAELLLKAKSSALLSVEIYNKPTVDFRFQAFVVLFHVAWVSLFLAIFHRDGVRPFYRMKNGYNYVKMDGERKAWDLSECVSIYWGANTNAVRQNLQFFIALRNRIEHYRDQTVLSMLTFGECQSLVTNFEQAVTREFGSENSLSERLSLSIQLSAFRESAREDVILKAVDKSTKSLTDFITSFRSSLDDDIFSDMRFSHKIFLLPKTANHMSRDALAIEWLDAGEISQDVNAEVDNAVALIKERRVPVRNPGRLLPRHACDELEKLLGLKYSSFRASSHHARCWKHFGIRPPSGSSDPAKCNTKYCQLDEAFELYVYTLEWVDFLEEQLSAPRRLRSITGYALGAAGR